MVVECFYTNRQQLFEAIQKKCLKVLMRALDNDRRVSFLVSGGSTPQPLYEYLANVDVNWSNVDVALVDERWVGPDQLGSNEAFIHNSLLNGLASSARFIPMKSSQNTALAGQAVCEEVYQTISSPFDLALLGMGADGHTASLFPACSGLANALDENNNALCAAITAKKSEVTGELTERMTMTLSGLLKSNVLLLLLTGEEKLAVYQRALVNKDYDLMPVSALLQQHKVPVHVYWSP